MQSKGIGAGDPLADDLRTQRAVLLHVVALDPTRLTLAEIATAICEDPDDFAEGDAVARAVRDLAAAGLVRMDGATVAPTLATLHFDRLSNV
ncbi:MAG TPA: hypothetical protein VHF50_02205 [Solirubrobacterales bacterium]|nr:hypothetical protein [Solirubrobacterales bacterium]